MIRPASEIEFPPSPAACMKARMLARMESLSSSSDALMAVITERLGAEAAEDSAEVEALTAEQQRLLGNMRRLINE